jgi:hypothetical protein
LIFLPLSLSPCNFACPPTLLIAIAYVASSLTPDDSAVRPNDTVITDGILSWFHADDFFLELCSISPSLTPVFKLQLLSLLLDRTPCLPFRMTLLLYIFLLLSLTLLASVPIALVLHESARPLT